MAQVDADNPLWGVATLTAANYAAFEDAVDKAAAESPVARPELRTALAHALDHGIAAAVDETDVPESTIRAGAQRCRRAAQNQYPDRVPDDVDT